MRRNWWTEVTLDTLPTPCYVIDEERLEDVYLSEMLPSKTGWNNLALEDEIIRGYTDEMRDFMESIYYDREPKSGFGLAYDVARIIYASY